MKLEFTKRLNAVIKFVTRKKSAIQVRRHTKNYNKSCQNIKFQVQKKIVYYFYFNVCGHTHYV